ncbi:MAG: beta-propeller fold lactonase family protein [Bacteroidota bacterium]
MHKTFTILTKVLIICLFLLAFKVSGKPFFSPDAKPNTQVTDAASGYAYILNQNSNSVSVIDMATNLVVTTISVGKQPLGIAISPFGDLIYVTNHDSNNISVIDAATNTVKRTIPAGIGPTGIAVNYLNDKLFVANDNLGGNKVLFISLYTDAITGTYNVGTNPLGVTYSAKYNLVYVADNAGDNIKILSGDDGYTSNFNAGKAPVAIAVTPDGKFAYVANSQSNNLTLINYLTGYVVNTIAVDSNPSALAMNTDGTLLYVANELANTVSVISTGSNTIINTINAGKRPSGLSLSQDGSLLYVLNRLANTVTVYNTITGNIAKTINVGTGPFALGTFIRGNPKQPVITTGSTNGSITACSGSASVSPSVLQFTVSGSSLNANIIMQAPAGFEISPAPNGVYTNGITLPQTGGVLATTTIYVRSAKTASVGFLAGNITLTSNGADNKVVPVSGMIRAVLKIDGVPNQAVSNGSSTATVNFSGNAGSYKWVNNTPGIGLAASGTGDIASFKAVNNSNSPITATITATPVDPTGFAYIATPDFDNLTVINTTTNEITTKIKVGIGPGGVALSPDASRVYVANNKDGTVSAINTATNTVIATIKVGTSPHAICVSPDGKFVYVANSESNSVSVINTASNTIAQTVLVGQSPLGIAISPDGKSLYVSNYKDGTVWVINTANGTEIHEVGVPYGVLSLAISPDGRRVYATDGSDNVTVIDTNQPKVVATIKINSIGSLNGIVVSPDGQKVYVSDETFGKVTVIDAYTNTILNTISLGTGLIGPQSVSISPDGKKLYLPNQFTNTVSIITTADDKIVATIPVAGTPFSSGNFVSGGNGCGGLPVTFTITVNPGSVVTGSVITTSGSLAAVSTVQGVPSEPTTFSVGGTNLKSGILVSPPAGFEVSTDNITFDKTVTVGTTGNVVATTVYLRLAASDDVGNYSGDIVLSSNGATSINLPSVLSTVSKAATQAVISAGPVSGVISACAGTPSSNPNIQKFTVSGTGLSGDITITAPKGFELSVNAGSGYANKITLSPKAGTVTAITVYARSAAANAPGNIAGNAVLTAAGAASQNAALTASIKQSATLSPVSNQTVKTGANTVPVNFTANGAGVSWLNDNPAIGLPASGTGNIAAFKAINNSGSPITATITASLFSDSPSIAYIADGSPDGGVWLVDIRTNEKITKIRLGNGPAGVAVSPDGSRVYVTNEYSQNLSVVNTATQTVLATINVGTNPRGVCVSPDGSRVYVANYASNDVSVINTSINANIATIAVGRSPQGIAVSPDGTRLYVANSSTMSNSISVINTADNTILSTIEIGNLPFGLCVSPDGKRVYTCGNNIVTVFNTSTNTATARIPVDKGPYSVIINSDGSRVYVSNLEANTVSVINTATNTIIATVPVKNGPSGISLTPDGSKLYVINNYSSNFSIINTATNTLIYTSPEGQIGVADSFGNFISGGGGCPGQPVSFTITVNPSSTTGAVISATGPLSALNTIYGTASQSASFSVSGENMTSGILVTPPAGFEVSADNKTFRETISVGTSGTIAPTTVYVRLAATAPAGMYSGKVTLSSPGAADISIAAIESKITKANLTITAADKNRAVGDVNPVFTFKYAGFVNGDSEGSLNTLPSATTTATVTSPAGTYSIIPGGATSSNYDVTYINGTLTVQETAPVITFNPLLTKNYGAPDFDPGATASDGEAIIYTSDNPAVATVVDGKIHIVGVGTVNITATIAPNSKYPVLPSKTQNLEVDKAFQTITFDPIPDQFTGTHYNLASVTASSGLPVIFSVSDTQIANVAGTRFNSVKAGTVVITASQAGDANYQPAHASQIVNIIDANGDNLHVHKEVSPNGDGFNDFMTIDGIEAFKANTVSIYNRNGVVVFQVDGYDNLTHVFDGHSNKTGLMQQAGTYFYAIEITVNNKTTRKVGYFVLRFN